MSMGRLITFLTAAFFGTVQVSHAYKYVQLGVDSNLLIDDGHAIFAQSDGSLTMLDVNTGQVLQRQKNGNFSGTLKRIPPGILMLQYGSLALLNPTNLAIIWETKVFYSPNVLSNTIISYDGNGLVQNRRLTDGAVRWTYELAGALDVIAEKGKVLVHRAATYETENITITVLLDLESGKELLRRTPPAGIHWPEVFFNGENIFVEQASFGEKRSDYKVESLIVWDTQGKEVRTIPIDSNLRDSIRWRSPFDLDQKTFYSGRVYSNRWSIPDERFGLPLPLKEADDILGSAYDLGDGFTFVARVSSPDDAEYPKTEIDLRSPLGHWTGELPYLAKHGRISALARAPGKILIGSNLGHVECVNATNGQSLWLYVFPTMHQTVSYSSHGMPPTMSQAAETFHRENGHPPTSGLKVENQAAKPTRVILDPQPTNPFRKLPLLLGVTWAGAVVPFALLVFLHSRSRTGHLILGPISVLLVGVSFFCFMSYGRLSPGSSIALRIAIIVGIAFGLVDAVRCFQQKKWVIGALVVGTCLGLTLLIIPFLFPF